MTDNQTREEVKPKIALTISALVNGGAVVTDFIKDQFLQKINLMPSEVKDLIKPILAKLDSPIAPLNSDKQMTILNTEKQPVADEVPVPVQDNLELQPINTETTKTPITMVYQPPNDPILEETSTTKVASPKSEPSETPSSPGFLDSLLSIGISIIHTLLKPFRTILRLALSIFYRASQ